MDNRVLRMACVCTLKAHGTISVEIVHPMERHRMNHRALRREIKTEKKKKKPDHLVNH